MSIELLKQNEIVLTFGIRHGDEQRGGGQQHRCQFDHGVSSSPVRVHPHPGAHPLSPSLLDLQMRDENTITRITLKG